MGKIYTIKENHYIKLIEKLVKLSKKAKKINVTPPTIDIVEEKIIPDPKNAKRRIKILDIEVSSTIIKYAGWEFVGVVQHEKYANILRLVDDIKIPEKYKTDTTTCEHCNTDRYRKDTYIVRSENGEFKRVGRTCLIDFLGHKNIEQIASYFEMLLYFISEINNDENYTDDYGDEWDNSFSYINPETYLAAVCFIAEKNGWVSASKSKETGIPSTSQEAFIWMIDDDFNISVEYEDFAKKAIMYAQNISDEDRINNNYLHNLWAISHKPFIQYRDLGLFASIYIFYIQQTQKEFSKSQYIGTIGKRENFHLQYTGSKTIHGDYYQATKYLLQFQDESGNIVIWFTEKPPWDLAIYTYYNVKATVKKHQEYNHVKQTIVNRCVFDKK